MQGNHPEPTSRRLRPFHESLQFAVTPKGQGGETGKRRLAACIWRLACVSECDEYLQTMRAVIFERFPDLYLQPYEEIREGLRPQYLSPEDQYCMKPNSCSVPEEFVQALTYPPN